MSHRARDNAEQATITRQGLISRQDLISRLAAATARYPFKQWGFGESIAMEALLTAGGEPGDLAASWISGWVSGHAPLRTDPLAHVAPGVPLLILAERATGHRDAVIACAKELAAILETSLVGRHGAQIHRPDLAGWEHEVWVDCMHLDGPFLAHLARVTGERRYADLAAAILLSHARVLQDERTGLFSHGFNDATGRPNRILWGRGQGWALLGLVDTAAQLPDGHATLAEIRQRLDALVHGLAASEAEPGAWHTVVDAPETYMEVSVGAFVALGIGRAVRHGLLPGPWTDLADRAWQATARRIAPDGSLPGVSDATPVGTDAVHYGARPLGVFPWGQGPALLAAVERLAPAEARHG
jgi:rhamnogalacturonyl hydrolase YesR